MIPDPSLMDVFTTTTTTTMAGVAEVTTTESATSMFSSFSSLRSYASLLVISAVLLDIVLGSPVANAVLKPIRNQAMEARELDEQEQQQGKRGMTTTSTRASTIPLFQKNLKERIDTEAVARAALDKAAAVTELRAYLDSRKTDEDRIKDMLDKLDREMNELDIKNRKQ
jgi:hypothetical protein